jgi:hypothetical protein
MACIRPAVAASADDPRAARASGLAGMAGVAVFVVVCSAAQYLRPDLKWLKTPLSFYLNGPGGWAVKLAYLANSVALFAIGSGFHSSLASAARSGTARWLFAIAAATLAITAFSESGSAHNRFEPIHLLAAATTFLCVTTAMLLQAVRLRHDARWKGAFAFALGLAIVALAALCIYALWHTPARGLTQKTVIALIEAWLGWAAYGLWRRARSA